MTLRGLGVGLIALLVAVQLVRIAAVEALAKTRPSEAERVWNTHPEVELQTGLTAIAAATRERGSVSPEVFDRIFDAATKEPLAAEPYLVRGVQAQLSRNAGAAERAFLAAERRDARSLPSRFFLAELYFRRGESTRGLAEIGALARLAPNGVQSLAPYVAAYARDRSTWPQLRTMFRSEPRLEDATLSALATDARNTDTVLALANRSRSGPSSTWLAPLLDSLGKAGQFGRARAIWASVAHVQLDRGALVFDPDFTRSDAPPPFNWVLTSSTVGLAERERGAGLHVIFYGQEDGSLASELLVLRPGTYGLTTKAVGNPTNGDALLWTVTCAGGKEPFARIPRSSGVNRQWRFTVPTDCPAQRLELFGSSSDIPKQSEARIRGISLVAETPGA